MEDHPVHRRIDRIRDPAFVEGLRDLSLDDLRERRDECMAEREYLSLLRRLLQGRAEILQAELEGRGEGGDRTALVERLTTILSGDDHIMTSRGEAVRIGVPEEEMLLARRRVERLATDSGISDPTTLDDGALADAIHALAVEEHNVSEARRAVITILDTVQDELKRRYKDDPSLALH
ncbi:MAG: aerial mycelium formation protein [Actinobacteria bacterium]|nr:MAG: aerial mycelium formation protein [Actinomycetota bacterium]